MGAREKKKLAAAVAVVPKVEPAEALAVLLTDREVLKIVHRALYDTGWHLQWGYEKHRALSQALHDFFGADAAHLRRR